MFSSLDLSSCVECKGKLYVVRVKASNSSILSTILDVLSYNSENILGYAVSKSDKEVNMTLILGLDNANELADIERDLLRIEDVNSVSHNALSYKAISTKYYPIKFHGMRVVMFGEPILKSIVEGIRKEYGEEAGSILLWSIGYQGGLGVAREFKEKYAFKNVEDYFAMLKLRGIILGWFTINRIDIYPKSNIIILRMLDNWECDMLKGKHKKPQSHFIRGVISGFASYVLGRIMVAKEIKCIAKGDDYCEFIILEKHKANIQ